MPAQHFGGVGRFLVGPAQIRREGRAESALFAVGGRTFGEQQVEGVVDLVAGAGGRAGVAGDRHRDAAEHQRLGQHLQEAVVADAAGMPEHRLAGLAGHGRGETVDLLAVNAVGQLPVRDRVDVGDRVADAGPDEAGRGLADHVQVDDDRDRVRHAVGAAPGVVVEGGDRRAQAVVREVRRHGDQGQTDARRGELGAVDDLAAAEPDDGVVVAGLHLAGQPDRVVQGAAADLVPAGAGQRGGDALAQPGAGAAADGDGEPAGLRDALVGEDAGQVVQGTRADVHDDRRGNQPGQ